MSDRFDIMEELKKLPSTSGVYLMKGENDEIIYVGKAVKLKNRVSQYFHPSKREHAKTAQLRSQIKEFEYIVTDTEVEALILECNLIKKYMPKYNVLMKDNKTYPYLKITVNEDFPRLFVTREKKRDGSKYFGPFTNAGALKETRDLIYATWHIRNCNRNLPKDINKKRPCLQQHIGRCEAPCAGKISREDYALSVEGVLKFLNGGHEKVIKDFKIEMEKSSEDMLYEKAAIIRDKIIAIESIVEKQKANSGYNNQDVIAFARAMDEVLVQVFFIRDGKMLGREHFILNNIENSTREEVMTGFIKQFYSETTIIPKELILEVDIEDKETIINWLNDIRGHQVTITVPQKGEKKKLVEMAHKNAILTLEQFGENLKRERNRTIGATEEIATALKLDISLSRVEAYDISNTQGFETVASMVVFEHGKPKRNDYRKFKIRENVGPDDYGAMTEVIRRRFLRYLEETKAEKNEMGKFNKLPDLLMIDGGKGQVNVVERTLDEVGIYVPVCGMIKDDNHRTRGLIYNNEEITMKYTSEGFKLITRIQDEVHRFAIEYHRKLRDKKQTYSILDDINGIGATRRKALIKHFGSVEKIKNASLEELSSIDSMNSLSAEKVYEFFKKK